MGSGLMQGGAGILSDYWQEMQERSSMVGKTYDGTALPDFKQASGALHTQLKMCYKNVSTVELEFSCEFMPCSTNSALL